MEIGSHYKENRTNKNYRLSRTGKYEGNRKVKMVVLVNPQETLIMEVKKLNEKFTLID